MIVRVGIVEAPGHSLKGLCSDVLDLMRLERAFQSCHFLMKFVIPLKKKMKTMPRIKYPISGSLVVELTE